MWPWLSTPIGIPFWLGSGEFTTRFRLPILLGIESDVHWGYDLAFDPWPCHSIIGAQQPHLSRLIWLELHRLGMWPIVFGHELLQPVLIACFLRSPTDVTMEPLGWRICCIYFHIAGVLPSVLILDGSPHYHDCGWETFYIFAYCGLVGNPHLTTKIYICCSPSNVNQDTRLSPPFAFFWGLLHLPFNPTS